MPPAEHAFAIAGDTGEAVLAPPGASRTITVRFSPTMADLYWATLTIQHNDLGQRRCTW